MKRMMFASGLMLLWACGGSSSGGGGATLSSIAVTPAAPTMTAGQTQQFTASGTYSDATTKDITDQVTWDSSSTATATISSGGLATLVAAGTTTISAAMGGKNGSTMLTVTAAVLAVTTTSLPSGDTGTSYSAQFAATGGTPPYTWSITSGTLPAGVTLNASTGAIAGTPTTAASSSFTVKVTDAASGTATKALSIAISQPLSISSISLPIADRGTAYTAEVAGAGGTSPYTWSVTAGALPPGLALNASTGAITGTPTALGTAAFTMKATDAANRTTTKALSIVVAQSLWASSTDAATATVAPIEVNPAVELGVIFKSDVAGSVVGVRFYKATENTGEHIAHLWSVDAPATPLATATFTGETTTGWQQVTFGTPVHIEADLLYVASYHTTVGRFSYTPSAFATAKDSAPLHAPADTFTTGGTPNGVYLYDVDAGGTLPKFPDGDSGSKNYWVDVLFTTP